MHRHGYKGRKFSREKDQRRALQKGLATNLIDNGSITTTTPKAKELAPYFEKLITKAKKGDLHNRRQVISKVATIESAHKLVDEIAPKLTKRTSGYLRIAKQDNTRRGDNAQMAVISFVDDVVVKEEPKEEVKKAPAKKKLSLKKKPNAKATVKPASVKKKVATHTNKSAAKVNTGQTKGDR